MFRRLAKMLRRPHLLKLICAAALMTLGLFAQPAWSITITAADITDGTTHASVPGADIDANGGTFVTSSFNGWDGFFGVQTGAVPAEIDILNDESIVITFDTPQVIDLIEIGRLFAEGSFGDGVNERAEIIVEREGASPLVGLLTVIDASNASWTGSVSTPINLSLGNESGAGVWRVIAPFGENAVTSLTFDPFGWPNITPQDGGQNSDFALLTITATPEPHTAALFGLGLAGLAILGRRQSA
jgi:hypothetical protein